MEKSLEKAKDRLAQALSKLETNVEKKMKSAEATRAASSADAENMTSELNLLKQEYEVLQEKCSTLESELKNAEGNHSQLDLLKEEVSKELTSSIEELKGVLEDQKVGA